MVAFFRAVRMSRRGSILRVFRCIRSIAIPCVLISANTATASGWSASFLVVGTFLCWWCYWCWGGLGGNLFGTFGRGGAREWSFGRIRFWRESAKLRSVTIRAHRRHVSCLPGLSSCLPHLYDPFPASLLARGVLCCDDYALKHLEYSLLSKVPEH